MEDGIILIDKPSGMTSFGVVARIRRVLSKEQSKKVKVGHTGTLDPFATGLMILVVGKECKNAERYSKLDKTYEATIHLGQKSSTGDPEGDLTDISDTKPGKIEIKDIIKKFIGEINQSPPIYSAIKIGGQRAYKLARKGHKIETPKRQITIYNLKVVDYKYPEIKLIARVGSGTYIRSLAEDIGEMLGVGAYCNQLRRTEIDKWKVDEAHKLSDFL